MAGIPNQHPPAGATESGVIVGRPASPLEIDEFGQLSKFYNPDNSISRLETFAKWLFASTTVLSTLSIGAGTNLSKELSPAGEVLLVLAIACLGISLGAACLSLAPRGITVHKYSLEDLRTGFSDQIHHRTDLLKKASFFFAAAIVLAGLVPAGKLVQCDGPGVQIGYAVDPEGNLQATAQGNRLPLPATLTLRLERRPSPEATEVLASSRAIAAKDGTSSLTLARKIDNRSETKVILVAQWDGSNGRTGKAEVELLIPKAVQGQK